jgi:hypothetical protein
VSAPASDAGAAVASGVFVQARLHGFRDGRASVSLNGKLVGSWPFSRGETRVVAAQGGSAELLAGLNELVVHTANARGHDPAFLVDWIHLGSGEPDPRYAAPTRREAVASMTLGAEARRAVNLRQSGSARWVGAVAPGSRLKGGLGLSAPGNAKVVIRRHRDGEPPRVLLERNLDASAARQWVPIDVEVEAAGAATELCAIEVAVQQASAGVRVALGDLRLTEPHLDAVPPKRAGTARVVVVVLGAWPTDLGAVPGSSMDLPTWTSLAQRGRVFKSHRASSTRESASVASLLTGLHPSEHGLSGPRLVLPKDVPLVSELARQASVPTAAFTANPSTGPAFGFARGWDTMKSFSPARDAAAQTLESAAEWVRAHKDGRFLLLVHARGGHPPWDISERELKDLPPPNYAGGIDPKRAAETLAGFGQVSKRFTEADRTRVWASYVHAVRREDAALGQLVRELVKIDDLRDTTLIVTGDVGVARFAAVPLAPVDGLDETALSIPLAIVAPRVAGGEVIRPSSSVDVAATLVASLGLEVPQTFRGADLLAPAREARIADGPLVAYDQGVYSVRWADFVVAGHELGGSRFCFARVEPRCASDMRGSYPIALEALLGQLASLRAMPVRVAEQGVFLDPIILDQLTSWGLGIGTKRKR